MERSGNDSTHALSNGLAFGGTTTLFGLYIFSILETLFVIVEGLISVDLSLLFFLPRFVLGFDSFGISSSVLLLLMFLFSVGLLLLLY